MTEPQKTPFETSVEYLSAVTVELFGEAGIPLEPAPTVTPPGPAEGGDLLVASVIGYAGERMRGALVLFASADTVRRWQPRLEPGASLDVVLDKIGEFCNMLLGRLKYRLLLRGAAFLFGTPTTAAGNALSVLATGTGNSRWLRFDGPSGSLHVRFDATFDEGFALKTGPVSDPPAPAGDMLLF